MVNEKYLLDANSFMTPYQNYYPFDFAPAYWRQLEPLLKQDNISVMDVVRDEILKGGDKLTEWIMAIEGINILDRRDPKILESYIRVLKFIQDSPFYNDKALRVWSDASVADPWLIAAASAYGYVIVTIESGAGKINPKTPSGRPKIPDIARIMGVRCENLFYFIRKTGIQFT